METFSNGVAVVTGGASGIGFAMAKRFAAEGMAVVLADIEETSLEAAVQELTSAGATAIGHVTDVSKQESVQDLAEATIAAFGKVTLLCNNAGVESGGSFQKIPQGTWQWVMDVNFTGVLNGCRAFLPYLEQQPEAHIVNTGSLASFATGTPTMTPYCASKFAVLGMSECLEIELRSSGSPVGVSILAPGPVKTRMPDSERNRPGSVQPAAEESRIAMMRALAEKTAASGLEPDQVAEMVIEAVRERRFFILPHPEAALAAMQRRLRWMEFNEAPVRRVAGT